MRTPGSAKKHHLACLPLCLRSLHCLFVACSFLVFSCSLNCLRTTRHTRTHTYARALARPRLFFGETRSFHVCLWRTLVLQERVKDNTCSPVPGLAQNAFNPRYHCVEHFPEDAAAPLFRAQAGAEGYEIAVMLRSDVYRWCQARGRGTPSPVEVRVPRNIRNALPALSSFGTLLRNPPRIRLRTYVRRYSGRAGHP